MMLSFNPHTHEGCDVLVLQIPHTLIVSIHTPTKGVTLGAQHNKRHDMVSIHTPTKGVTVGYYVHFLELLVSIHTPTKGVTIGGLLRKA